MKTIWIVAPDGSSNGIFIPDDASFPAVPDGYAVVDTRPADPAPLPPPVPASITRFQAYAALLNVSPGQDGDPTLYHTVQRKLLAGKDLSPAGLFAWLAWTSAGDFLRDGVLINGMAAGFSLNPAMLDSIFRNAAQIEA